MKRFELGKTYSVQGGGLVTVTGMTKAFVTFSGDFSGRKKVYAAFDNGLLGLGEHLVITRPDGCKVLCFADHERSAEK